ncbi:MAG TPA: SpoIIE family protein phosphatase [Bryobacteraceae bacterium]|nr:SpoIIE family protein phosphatase [Bryobacteraceae bacterium]
MRDLITIQTPDKKTHTIELDRDSYRIGRSPANDLSYSNIPGLSREHLVIERQGTQWVVRDLGSTFGTLVNGSRIDQPTVVGGQDRITAGQLSLTFGKGHPDETVVFVEDSRALAADDSQSGTLETMLQAENQVRSGEHMRALIRAGRELATHLPLDRLFDLILDLSVQAVQASRGVLMTLESDELKLRANQGGALRISSHVRDLVLREKRSLLVRDAMLDAQLAAHQSIVADQIRSILAVPLQTDERVIGLIYLDSVTFVREFTRDDLSLLTVMANMAAVRIENARLAEIEQAEKLRAQELEHAAMIQRSMLPSVFPAFPDHSEFELHGSMIPAREVGGDLFDFFLLDPDHLAFVVGDVSGKGVPAALYLAVSRTLLRATARLETEPGECLTHINASLVEQNTSGMFITLFYGVLNLRTGEILFSSAGHNPPYLFCRDGQLRQLREKSGPMLGLLEGIEYRTEVARLAPGEGLLMYTDGVTEAINPRDEFFNESGLEQYLAAHAADAMDQLIDGLRANIQTFAAGKPQADDITVLGLRYLGQL